MKALRQFYTCPDNDWNPGCPKQEMRPACEIRCVCVCVWGGGECQRRIRTYCSSAQYGVLQYMQGRKESQYEP
jgi:hypothetical protein